MTYSPQLFEPLTFFDMTPRFRDGSDTPRAYLERCLAVIADREPVVKAWVVLNPSGAREAADASTAAPIALDRRVAYRKKGAIAPIPDTRCR
jgi:hypothetical protein